MQNIKLENKAKKLGGKFQKKLLKLLNRAQKGQKLSYDNDYAILCLASLSELIVYTKLISAGKMVKAFEAQEDMDSSVRDSIPIDLYNVVEEFMPGGSWY